MIAVLSKRCSSTQSPSIAMCLGTMLLLLIASCAHFTDAFGIQHSDRCRATAGFRCYNNSSNGGGSCCFPGRTPTARNALAAPSGRHDARPSGDDGRKPLSSSSLPSPPAAGGAGFSAATTDVAKVWAESLEHKIPWHAGSRRYLRSDASGSP